MSMFEPLPPSAVGGQSDASPPKQLAPEGAFAPPAGGPGGGGFGAGDFAPVAASRRERDAAPPKPKQLVPDSAFDALAGRRIFLFGGRTSPATAARPREHEAAPRKEQLVSDGAFDALAGRHVSPFSDGGVFRSFWNQLTGRQSPSAAARTASAGGAERR